MVLIRLPLSEVNQLVKDDALQLLKKVQDEERQDYHDKISMFDKKEKIIQR